MFIVGTGITHFGKYLGECLLAVLLNETLGIFASLLLIIKFVDAAGVIVVIFFMMHYSIQWQSAYIFTFIGWPSYGKRNYWNYQFWKRQSFGNLRRVVSGGS